MEEKKPQLVTTQACRQECGQAHAGEMDSFTRHLTTVEAVISPSVYTSDLRDGSVRMRGNGIQLRCVQLLITT